MEGKQQISLWVHWEDYQELKKSPLGVSGAIREALSNYLCRPNPTVEKLQKVISEYEKLVNSPPKNQEV